MQDCLFESLSEPRADLPTEESCAPLELKETLRPLMLVDSWVKERSLAAPESRSDESSVSFDLAESESDLQDFLLLRR